MQVSERAVMEIWNGIESAQINTLHEYNQCPGREWTIQQNAWLESKSSEFESS